MIPNIRGGWPIPIHAGFRPWFAWEWCWKVFGLAFGVWRIAQVFVNLKRDALKRKNALLYVIVRPAPATYLNAVTVYIKAVTIYISTVPRRMWPQKWYFNNGRMCSQYPSMMVPPFHQSYLLSHSVAWRLLWGYKFCQRQSWLAQKTLEKLTPSHCCRHFNTYKSRWSHEVWQLLKHVTVGPIRFNRKRCHLTRGPDILRSSGLLSCFWLARADTCTFDVSTHLKGHGR